MNCSICSRDIEGIEVFGNLDFPLCWNCYAERNNHCGESYYGLAPHHHDITLTGSIIGSTVFDDLPEPSKGCEYDLGHSTFIPDPDVLGLGIWTPKTPIGWR